MSSQKESSKELEEAPQQQVQSQPQVQDVSANGQHPSAPGSSASSANAPAQSAEEKPDPSVENESVTDESNNKGPIDNPDPNTPSDSSQQESSNVTNGNGSEANSNEPKEPEVVPALATEGGREVSHKILYVGDLNKDITEDQLKEIFSVDGMVQSVKILADKNRPGFNYAFVEYDDEKASEAAFSELNGHQINNCPIKINWAYQSQQAKNDPNSFNIFVGDLSTEVNDELLRESFSKYQSLLQAHVMWDMQSGRSRGYGFVSFADQKDAEDALASMNGTTISNRAIRLNWASHKQINNMNNSVGSSNDYRNYNNNNNSNNNPHHHHHNNHHHNNHHHANHHNAHHHHHNPHHNNHAHHNHYQHQRHHPGNNYSQYLSNGSNPNLMNPNGSIPSNQMNSNGVLSNPPINSNNQLSGHHLGPPPNNGGNLPTNGNGNVPPPAPPGMNNGGQPSLLAPQTYELVLRKAPSWQTTVYLGNLARFTSQNDLVPILQNFGFIVDLRFLPEKNCAFVKYDSHERAAVAIVQLSGIIINGRPLKSGWGKDRSNNNIQYQNYGPIVYGQGR